MSRIGSQVNDQFSIRFINEIDAANGKSIRAPCPQDGRGVSIQRNRETAFARGNFARPKARARANSLVDSLHALIRNERPTDLCEWPALDDHDVGGEVVLSADQAGSDAVHVDGYRLLLELGDPLGVEAAGDDDLDVTVSR